MIEKCKCFLLKIAAFINKLIVSILSICVCVTYFYPTMVYALTIQEEKDNKYGPYYHKDISNSHILNNDTVKSNVNEINDNYYTLNNDTFEYDKNATYFGDDSNTYVENGSIKTIDTTIKRLFAGVGSNYAYGNTLNTIKSLYPSSVDNPIKLTKDNTSLYIKLINYKNTDSPILNDSELIYLLNDNVNLDITIKNNKLLQNLVINGPIDEYSFDFEFSVDNGYYMDSNGLLNIYDNNDNYLFTYYAPLAYDSNGSKTDVIVSINDNIITYSIDEDWAKSQDRVYPITIDPEATIWGHSSYDVSVASNRPTYTLGYEDLSSQGWSLMHEENAYMYVGNHPTFGDTYTFFKVKDSSADDPLYKAKGKYIKSAYVHIKIADKNLKDGNDSLITCRLNSAFSPTSVNYNNSSSLINGASDCVKYPLTNDTTSIKFDLTDYTKDVIQNGKTNYGFVFYLEKQSDSYVRFYANEYQNWGSGESGAVPGGVIYYYDSSDIKDYDDVSVNLRPFVKYKYEDGLCHFVSLGIDGKSKYKENVHIKIENQDGSTFYSKDILTKSDFFIYPNYSVADPEILNSYTDKESNYQLDEIVDGFDTNKVYKVIVSDDSGHNVTSTFRTYEVGKFDLISNIAAYYGVDIQTLINDNNLTDGLLVEGNLLFIREPSINIDSEYETLDLTEDEKKEIDASLTHRNKECEFGYEPINLNTGSYYLESNDITLKSGDNELSFNRIYNSKSSDILSTLGYGFRHNFDSYILTNGEDAIVYLTDGSELLFTCIDGKYQNELDDSRELTVVSGHFELIDLNDLTTYVYNEYNKLETIKKYNGKIINLFYENTLLDKITFDNKELVFTYNNSLLSRIDINNNSYITYEYDTNNNLIKFTDAVNNTFEYTYDNDHNLLTYNVNNSNIVTNTYDDMHRVTNQANSNGSSIQLTYYNDYTLVDELNGNTKKIYFDSNGQTTKIEYSDGTCEKNHLRINYLSIMNYQMVFIMIMNMILMVI